MKLGVICAMEQEIGLLSTHGVDRTLCGVPLAEVTFGGTETVIALSGIGKSNAAACTQMLIDRFAVDAILNIGLAGSACPLPLGGAVVIDRAVYHDFDMNIAAENAPFTTFYTPDAALQSTALAVLAELGVPHQSGTLATGDQFIADSAVKADIVSRTGCACVEMEGAAIAHMAQKNGVPCCLVKVLSDTAEESASDEFHAALNMEDYLRTSTGFIAAFAKALSAE